MKSTESSTIDDRRVVEPPDTTPKHPGSTSARLAAYRADIRARSMNTGNVKLGARILAEGIRRFSLDLQTTRTTILVVTTGVAVRLLIAVIVTALWGNWAGTPLGPWFLIAFLLALADIARLSHHSPSARAEEEMRQATALLDAIENESELRELAHTHQRWWRLPVSMTGAAVLTAGILTGCWLASPEGMEALPAGSIAMLTMLLYDLGEITVIAVVRSVLGRRQASCDHRLFWLDPANTLEAQQQMRMTVLGAVWFGLQVTVALVLAIVLVSPSSSLVLPLAIGITLVGYATILTTMIDERSSILRIVRRSRDKNLTILQDRLAAYEPGKGKPEPPESGDLDRLIVQYNALRDASTSLRWARSLGQTVMALLVPTLMFIITVFGEVSAERLLERILP